MCSYHRNSKKNSSVKSSSTHKLGIFNFEYWWNFLLYFVLFIGFTSSYSTYLIKLLNSKTFLFYHYFCYSFVFSSSHLLFNYLVIGRFQTGFTPNHTLLLCTYSILKTHNPIITHPSPTEGVGDRKCPDLSTLDALVCRLTKTTFLQQTCGTGSISHTTYPFS